MSTAQHSDLKGSFMRTSCRICVQKELAPWWKTSNFIKTLVYVIGQFNSQSCLLFIFKYQQNSLNYSWPSCFDWVLYKNYWEFPIQKKTVPILTYPIDLEIKMWLTTMSCDRYFTVARMEEDSIFNIYNLMGRNGEKSLMQYRSFWLCNGRSVTVWRPTQQRTSTWKHWMSNIILVLHTYCTVQTEQQRWAAKVALESIAQIDYSTYLVLLNIKNQIWLSYVGIILVFWISCFIIMYYMQKPNKIAV